MQEPAIPFAKITEESVDQTGKKITENIGYTDVNVFSEETADSIVTALQAFAAGVTSLTTNTHSGSKLTYEVKLDTL